MTTEHRPMNSLSLASQAWQSSKGLPACMGTSRKDPWPAWIGCTQHSPVQERTDQLSTEEWSGPEDWQT